MGGGGTGLLLAGCLFLSLFLPSSVAPGVGTPPSSSWVDPPHPPHPLASFTSLSSLLLPSEGSNLPLLALTDRLLLGGDGSCRDITSASHSNAASLRSCPLTAEGTVPACRVQAAVTSSHRGGEAETSRHNVFLANQQTPPSAGPASDGLSSECNRTQSLLCFYDVHDFSLLLGLFFCFVFVFCVPSLPATLSSHLVPLIPVQSRKK